MAPIVYEAMLAPSDYVFVHVCMRVQHGFMQEIAQSVAENDDIIVCLIAFIYFILFYF